MSSRKVTFPAYVRQVKLRGCRFYIIDNTSLYSHLLYFYELMDLKSQVELDYKLAHMWMAIQVICYQCVRRLNHILLK